MYPKMFIMEDTYECRVAFISGLLEHDKTAYEFQKFITTKFNDLYINIIWWKQIWDTAGTPGMPTASQMLQDCMLEFVETFETATVKDLLT